MESRSMSSSSASTVPSVLESNSRSDGSSAANYEDEQFESEGDHESAVAAPPSLNSSSSDKYGSDDFEDDHEVSVTVKGVEVGSSEGDKRTGNDYDLESFECEDEAYSEQKPDGESEHRDLDPQEIGEQQQLQDIKVDDEKQPAEAEELMPATEKDLKPQLGNWCSKKILDLRAATTKVESNQPQIKKALNRIPDKVVEDLITRATDSRRSRSNQNTRPCSRSKIKVPASLMQRAQTQLWVAKSSSESTSTMRRPNMLTLETHSTSTHSVVATFCCVKRENLLGKLATMEFSEIAKRSATSESGGLSLATLDFVQSMAMKQRGIYNSSGPTDQPGGKMLHRVAMAARLQLEDSIALRHHADELLGRVNEMNLGYIAACW